jgi:hypothetical protein
VEISQYNVKFVPRQAIKSQALTDFITEWTDSGLWGIDERPDHWMMYFDESYTLKRAGASIVLIPPEGDILKYAIQLKFLATNNIAEYEWLVTGLRLTKDLSIRWLLIRGDSQLVVKQVQKEYDCNNEMMAMYLVEVCMMKFFIGFEVWYVSRLDNRCVYHLARIASSRAPTPSDAIVEKLFKPSVKPEESISEETGVDLMITDEPAQ